MCSCLQDLLASHPNPKLEKLIQAGIGYHHAGMTKEERHCIESGFRDGVLLVITSTTTLSAGINLPAQRVILRGIRQGVSDLDRAQYLQMIGRAGRAGYSQRGESYIFGRCVIKRPSFPETLPHLVCRYLWWKRY